MSPTTTLEALVKYASERLEKAKLSFGHGTSNAYDEALFMVLEKIGIPYDEWENNWEDELSAEQISAVDALITTRIETRKPAAYLLNKAYIQGVPFYVDERVIVPRSYIGELLATDLFGGDDFTLIKKPDDITSVLDLCTGSGCLAILATHVFPNATVDAVDLSKDALAVAKVNVNQHGLHDRISLYEGDLFAPLENKKYDLILANPP
jgi:ribosomal protein L3 glutamine methyltransferase